MIVVSLFDLTGTAVHPWAEAGYSCFCFDLQHADTRVERIGKGSITYVRWDSDAPGWFRAIRSVVGERAYFLFGFPPCDDLAGCGAKHWEAKRLRDPAFQDKAAARARKCELAAKQLGARFVIENPSGALSRLWRRFDHSFHPCWYGGYVPHSEANHPLWPDYIPPRDAYRKLTCNWSGNGYVHPPHNPVEPEVLKTNSEKKGLISVNRQTKKLGGRSLKTKNIRSATRRGWAKAVFLHNRII